MAFSVNGGGNGFGRSRFRGMSTLSEINVVPLVDVVLVLLIIFMVTAHVMEFGMEVDVPKTKTQPKDTAEILPVVNIDKAGNLFLIDKAVNINDLGTAIRAKFEASTKAAYLRADKETPWEVVAQVISALSTSRIDIRVVTQPA